MDPLAFPPLAPSGHAPSGLVPARDFRTMIDQVAFSAATQMSRPVRTGVLVTADDEALVLSPQPMATGSLSTASTSALKAGPAPPGTALSLLIPAKTVIEIARLLVSGEVRLEISVNRGSSQVLFRVEAPTGGQVTVIGTRFLEGVIPDLERVLPSEPATEVTASRAELMTAIALDKIPDGEPADSVDGSGKPGAPGTPWPVEAGEHSLGSPDPGDQDDGEDDAGGDAKGALGREDLPGMDQLRAGDPGR